MYIHSGVRISVTLFTKLPVNAAIYWILELNNDTRVFNFIIHNLDVNARHFLIRKIFKIPLCIMLFQLHQ